MRIILLCLNHLIYRNLKAAHHLGSFKKAECLRVETRIHWWRHPIMVLHTHWSCLPLLVPLGLFVKCLSCRTLTLRSLLFLCLSRFSDDLLLLWYRLDCHLQSSLLHIMHFRGHNFEHLTTFQLVYLSVQLFRLDFAFNIINRYLRLIQL